MRAVATIGVGPMRPVLEAALPSFRSYAERHGCDLVVGSGASAGRPPSWGKVLLMRRLLETYDEVTWLDCDMVVLDHETEVSSLVPDDAFQAMVCHPELGGGSAPNAGMWFVRAREEAVEFLDEVWARGERPDSSGMWDNRAVLELLGYTTVKPFRLIEPSRWSAGTHYLPLEWNYPSSGIEFPPRTRIAHFCAMADEKRVRVMRFAALEALPEDTHRWSPWVRRAERAARRAELSLYVRRKGVSDRRRYSAARFGES